ncbi:hypothetical protein JW897_05105 [Chromobacterium alkanivorans]|uniref:hypothetical protein n=1 Tax=Chromobacterium alkanivorans TaxID=1071719 RepID=UPI0019684E70|nr:hypothetical protein [Chromobacterium alkanivorans]MBN3003110.1 hypothetical protein [Chromobacterium alkanivorans]
MPINHIAAYTPQTVVPNSENQSVQDFSGKSIRGRDVVIINPFCEGGGDHALANKIANLALEEGCRVTIVPVSANGGGESDSGQRNISLHGGGHDASSLSNPVFIVAPVGILTTEKLGETINRLCDQYQFPKGDIALIEEMDLLASPSQQLPERQELLQKMGFGKVDAFNLGFGKGAIGYLPVDPLTVNTVKDRFEGELVKLLDSCNLSLAKDSHYHLAYISSDTCVTASQVFIANTLTENKGSGKNANYVMVLRQLDGYAKKVLPNKVSEILNLRSQQHDFPALFAKANIAFADPDTGRLENNMEIKGEGQGQLNIVFANALPQNIFHDFMCLAHSGMASGDQSLGEFLSLTGKMPYYDMQPWKQPLAEAVKEAGAELGGAELKQAVAERIIGRQPFSGRMAYQIVPNLGQTERSAELNHGLNALDTLISTRTADHHIRALLTP